ncbi:tetratricopeptide repeat protein [Candidatus Uhrbacteria bacterium]|nr:tetratricopeptide repeat protein [Candidatus Uhrbacteria bacterium]
MRPPASLGSHLRCASRGLVFVLVFFLPLTVLPFTINPLELSKQTLLVILTLSATVLWLASMIAEKKVRFMRGWMNLIPLFYIAAVAVPAFSSSAPYLSLIGAHSQEYLSVATAVSIGMLTYLIGNTFQDRKSHKLMHGVLLVSTVLCVVLSLLSLFGISVFGSLTGVLAFNTVGTFSSFSAYLVVMNSFFLASLVSHRTNGSILHEGAIGTLERVGIVLIALCTFFFLLLVDNSSLWLLFVLSILCIFLFVFFRAQDFPSRARLIVPLILLLCALPFWFWFPGVHVVNLPVEVTLNTDSSLSIAEKTLQATSSTTGSGPGTYQFDFTQFHDPVLNQTDFWNTRFDRASSYVLTLLPTLGVLGVTLLSLFVLLLLLRTIHQVVKPHSRAEWLESFVHATPWIMFVISAFLIPWNMTLTAVFGIFSGLLASQVLRKEASRSFDRSPGVALMCSLLFLCVAFVLFIGVFVTTQRYAAEIAFGKAVELDRAGGALQEIVTELDRATTLNKYHDTYYRNLAEALLLRVDEALKGISSVDTLTPESAQYVQSLIAASVNAATQATTLSPNNVLNWLTRGSVYRNLIPVMGEATTFAIESYTRAIELEGVNPSNWVELGKTHLVAAEAIRPLTQATDEATAVQAHTSLSEHLTNAQMAFGKAIELKPNYAPAHFQLALTYVAEGRLDDAIEKMESVALYNPLDVGVQFQLGVLYLKRSGGGDVASAQAAFEKTISLSPEYSNAHWFLASIYESQGDLARAVQEVETVSQLNPGNSLVEAHLQNLLAGQVSNETPEAIEE